MSLQVPELARKAKKASRTLALAKTKEKNAILHELALSLQKNKDQVLEANQKDIDLGLKAGLNEAMIDRLSLQGDRMDGVIKDLESVITLDDPVGTIIEKKTLENGLQVKRVRTPLGVIGIIYESRPNVTVDCASLALKTGNAAILRGGKETLHSNRALVHLIQRALASRNFPEDSVVFIDSPDRQCVHDLLQCYQTVDMIIPRGGASLHRYCREESKIPVITGGIGICHLFVDETANLEKSLEIIYNAKTQRPTVCNALDTLLVHEKLAGTFIPRVIEKLGEVGVEFKVEQEVQKNFSYPFVELARAGDWDNEWLSLVLGIKVVKGLEEALDHIQTHSSGHSDGILTETADHAEKFMMAVDSAAVYVNASTRFTDGSQLGLGAEVAISTQKLHARGPMALTELTTYKWVIQGNYHCRP